MEEGEAVTVQDVTVVYNVFRITAGIFIVSTLGSARRVVSGREA